MLCAAWVLQVHSAQPQKTDTDVAGCNGWVFCRNPFNCILFHPLSAFFGFDTSYRGLYKTAVRLVPMEGVEPTRR